jgi:hypothetical protein
MIAQKESEHRCTAEELARTKTLGELLQHLDDSKVTAIAATGASLANIEEALLWAEGESDVLGKTDHPLTGAAAAVYEILIAEEAYPNEP